MRFLTLPTLLLLTACGTTQTLRPQPSPEQLSTPEGVQQATAVDVSGECRRFLKQVPHPAVVGLNGRVAWKAADHALSAANGRIKNADDCLGQQIRAYAKGLKPK